MVSGSSCSHKVWVIVAGGGPYATHCCEIDAGADTSCWLASDTGDVATVVVEHRLSANVALFPAAAVVRMMSTRTPTTQERFAAVPKTDRKGTAVVTALPV